MNAPATGLLDASQLASIVADVEGMLHDTDAGVELVWHTATSRAYNPGSGTADYAGDSTTLTAWLSDVTLNDLKHGAQMGDVQALIAAGDLSATPDTNDRFTVASGSRAGSYAVRVSRSGPLATHHYLYAYRVN